MASSRALTLGDLPDLIQQLRRLMAQHDVVAKQLQRPLNAVMTEDQVALATKVLRYSTTAADRTHDLLTLLERTMK